MTPSDPKSTVITDLGPLSCRSTTVPRPNLSCVILSPIWKSEIDSPLPLAADPAFGFDLEAADGAMRRVVTLPLRPDPEEPEP